MKIKITKLRMGYIVSYVDNPLGMLKSEKIERAVSDRKALKNVLGGLMVREVERNKSTTTICETGGDEK